VPFGSGEKPSPSDEIGLKIHRTERSRQERGGPQFTNKKKDQRTKKQRKKHQLSNLMVEPRKTQNIFRGEKREEVSGEKTEKHRETQKERGHEKDNETRVVFR